jgi:hypothetical protein
MRVLVLISSFILFTSCVPKVPEADNGCASACGNLRALKCEGAHGNPGGDGRWGSKDDQTCVEACADIVTARVLPIDTKCLSGAMSCQAADGC